MQSILSYYTWLCTAENESDLKHKADTPYLAITGELWGICCEDIKENWLHYNGTALYAGSCK